MGARRLRFLHPDLRDARGRARIPSPHLAHRVHHHRDARAASRRRAHLRLDRRPLRPPHPADDRRHLLFRRRSAERPRAELRMVPGDARAVRNRDGRRMGRGRVARDGSGRAAMARILFRTAAGGLCGRLSARGGGVLLRLPALRMARDVLSRRRARAADDLHPHQGAGVARHGSARVPTERRLATRSAPTGNCSSTCAR